MIRIFSTFALIGTTAFSSLAFAQTGPDGVLGGGNSGFSDPEYQAPETSKIPLPDVEKYVPESQQFGGEVTVNSVVYNGATIPKMIPIVDQIIGDFQSSTAGRKTAISVITALRDRITQAYISNGYINSGAVVPSQDLSSGNLKINIIEGQLTEIPVSFKTPSLANSLGLSDKQIVRTVSDINENGKIDDEDLSKVGWRPGQLRRSYITSRLEPNDGEALNQLELQKRFQKLTNDPAIKKIDAALTPGERPGEARLFLDIQENDPVWLYLSTASERAPSIGGERVALGGGFRNLIGYGDVITFEVGLTEGLNDALARYDVPIGSSRFSLNAHVQYSDAEIVEEPLSNLNILSDSFSYGGGVSARLLDSVYANCRFKEIDISKCDPEDQKSGSYSLNAGLDLSKKKTENQLLGIPFSFSPGAVNGETDNLVLTGSLDGSIRSRNQVAAARVSVGYGLDALEINQTNAPPENFIRINAQTQFARVISEKLGHQLIAKVNGQWTDKTLFTSERFAFGGIDSVRGYRKNDVLTDRGILGSVEYRMSLQPIFAKSQTRFFDNWSIGVFAEGGYGENTLLPDPVLDKLASIGAQFSVQLLDGLQGQFYYGYQIEDIASPRNETFQDSGFGFRMIFTGLNL